MDHNDKMLRLRSLIAEYDDDEDHHRDPTPTPVALEELFQKMKVVLNAGTEVTEVTPKNKATEANSESSKNDCAAVSSSSSGFSSQTQLIDGGSSKSNATGNEALENHDVLTEIFQCVSLRDLSYFRLVNKQWKGVANSTIIKRRLWKLKFKDKFRRSVKNINEVLLKLNGCIFASGGSFPLTTLDFSDVCYHKNLNHALLLRFYSLMGQSIKRVVFSNFGPLTVGEFQDLLMNKIPNVDHIDVGRIIFTNEEDRQLSLDLPNLKTITFIGNKWGESFKVQPYYKDLLLAAGNLKEIKDFRIQLTNIVMETGKMGCIQKLNFDLKLVTCSDLYVQFSHSEPKLTSLAITAGRYFRHDSFRLRAELINSLNRILFSSKDTLNHLRCLFHVFPVDSELPLPVFPNLEYLTVVDSDKRASAAVAFLPGCDCREIFPKLHTVCLRLCSPFKPLSEYFGNQTLPSVKTLEFQGGYQFEECFKRVFPNVSRIKIIDYHDIVDEARRAAQCFVNAGFYSHLGNEIESLEFHQCRLASPGQEFHLDSRFSGAPRRRCSQLLWMYNQLKARGEAEDTMIFKKMIEVQTQNGISTFRNYEGLRRLKILFNHPRNVDFRMPRTLESWKTRRYDRCEFECGNRYCTNNYSDSEDEDEDVQTVTPVITPVSCAYGFSLMPNLEQVIIGYDHTLPNASEIAQVFEPFAEFPYVKIVHERTDWSDYRK